MSNTCIRILADVNQIKECKEKVKNVDESLLLLSNAFNLVGNDVRIKILYSSGRGAVMPLRFK